jgi:hypothetical protein
MLSGKKVLPAKFDEGAKLITMLQRMLLFIYLLKE